MGNEEKIERCSIDCIRRKCSGNGQHTIFTKDRLEQNNIRKRKSKSKVLARKDSFAFMSAAVPVVRELEQCHTS